MIRPSILCLAVIGVLCAAMLGGCGRKGPLDPPPGAWVTPQGTRPITGAEQPAPPEYDKDGNLIAPSGPKRRIPLDWLLN